MTSNRHSLASLANSCYDSDPILSSPNALNRALSHPGFSPSATTRVGSPSPSRSPSKLGPSASLPLLGSPSSSRPQSRPLSRTGTTIEASSSTLAPRGVAGAKKTYGAARSFRRDVEEERLYLGTSNEPTVDAVSNSTSAATSSHHLGRPPLERKSYAAMRRDLGVDDDEEMEESQASESALKSISQLRAKGENSRFVDEFNYLVDGLGAGMALGIRRTR